MFADLPTLPSLIRLLLAIFATVQALLAARIVLVRAVRYVRGLDASGVERVPTAAMLAHGIFCAFVARTMYERIPTGAPIDWESITWFAAALTAGWWAYTHIVVLTFRENRRKGRASQQRARRQQSR